MRKNNTSLLLSIIFVFCFSSFTFGQLSEPVKWSFKVENLPNAEAMVKIIATVEDGWHLYSQYNTLGITQQTVFEYAPSTNYVLVGKTTEPQYVEFKDEFGTDRYFEKSPVTFVQKIKIRSKKDFTLVVNIDAQTCMEGKCVMCGRELKIPVKGAADAVDGENTKMSVDTLAAETPVDSENILAAVTAEINGAKIEDVVGEAEAGDKKMSLLMVFLIAFGAGLLTLITPCVFPLIPMTINFFMHRTGGDKPKSGTRQAWMFGGSIVFIYVILGVILALIFGPKVMYIIATHWIPNVIFFVIFMAFALSFFGLFEITLPSWMVNRSDAKADKGGWIAPFFIALTTVLVSFSCTGPILGAALVGLCTSGADRLIPLVSMLGFGVGFAAPFTLLAMFPSALSKMKSGSWLNAVKIVFAFLEIAFGLKFLSMADLYCGWHILDREVYLALWIVIFAMLGFYLLGKLRFAGDSEVKEISVLRLFLAILTFSFTIYMVPGMFGAPLKAISGFIPPMETQDFDVNSIVYEGTKQLGATVPAASALPADRKYAEELEMPTGFEGFYDLEEAKAYAKKVGKPIFIDFTGITCANCRKMEHYVWADPAVMPMLQNDFVMCALYADAKIKLPESEWTEDKKGMILKTVGQKNINFQEENYNINAQPYYVLIDEDGMVLTKNNFQYDKDVQHFIDFLNEGLANYKKEKAK